MTQDCKAISKDWEKDSFGEDNLSFRVLYSIICECKPWWTTVDMFKLLMCFSEMILKLGNKGKSWWIVEASNVEWISGDGGALIYSGMESLLWRMRRQLRKVLLQVRGTLQERKRKFKKRLKDTVGHILKHNTLIVWFGFLFRKISVSFHLLAHHARKICLCIE